MNLKQLQAMSDAELNELSAAKVMGYELLEEVPGGYHPFQGNYDWLENKANYPHFIKYPNGRVILWKIPSADGKDWNPATDMNDAMELVQAVGDDYNFELNRKPSGVDHLLYEAKFTDEDDVYRGIGESAPRCITIASILAKEEER